MNKPTRLQPTSDATAGPAARREPAVVMLFPAGEPVNAEAQAMPSVKRLLRHRFTRKYFSHSGWTDNPDEAQVFFDALEAAQTCAQLRLTGVELALHVGSGTCDIFSTPIR